MLSDGFLCVVRVKLMYNYMNIREWIGKNATGKKVLFSFAATQVVYGTMLLFSIPHVLRYSNGLKILDLIPGGYSSSYVKGLLDVLGTEGRAVYLWQQIPLDMLYPGLFAISYSLLLGYLFKKLSTGASVSRLAVLPLFSGLFDYLENIGIISMIVLYPAFMPWLANLTSIFSVSKSLTTVIVFTLLIAAISMLFFRWLRSVLRA